MTWSAGASGILTQWRTQLRACPSISAWEVEQFHYPALDLADGLSCVLLAETGHNRDRYAEGAVPLIGFSLRADFYLLVTDYPDAGYVETFARTIVSELGAQYYGFAWKSLGTDLASDPTPGMRATAQDESSPSPLYRVITVRADVGLTR